MPAVRSARTPRFLACAVLFTMGALLPTPTPAGEFEISPILVELGGTARTQLLTVRNAGTSATRLQVKVFAWSQDAKGQMVLGPTGDVLAFPTVLELAPGAARNVRVGTTRAAGDVEQSYRVFIEELPPPDDVPREAQVRMLTRIGIPVFISPTAPRRRLELSDASMARRVLRFALRNTGNVRVRPEAVHVVLRGAGEAVVSEHDLDTWYVLAGGERVYELPVEASACPKVRQALVSVRAETGQLERTVDLPADGCGP